MCELEKTILRSTRGLTDRQVADRMNAYLGKIVVTDDMVQKYMGGKSGVPIKYIGAFLASLGQKSVDHDSVVVDQDEFNAYRVLAMKQVNQDLDGSEG